jgi:hypothetical protein
MSKRRCFIKPLGYPVGRMTRFNPNAGKVIAFFLWRLQLAIHKCWFASISRNRTCLLQTVNLMYLERPYGTPGKVNRHQDYLIARMLFIAQL